MQWCHSTGVFLLLFECWFFSCAWSVQSLLFGLSERYLSTAVDGYHMNVLRVTVLPVDREDR